MLIKTLMESTDTIDWNLLILHAHWSNSVLKIILQSNVTQMKGMDGSYYGGEK